MVSPERAAELVQAYIDDTLMRPCRVWDHEANRMVEETHPPIRVWKVRRAISGFTATYNTVPPTLAGNHPLFVSADGSVVREATWREVWEADPDAYPHLRDRKDDLIALEESVR